MDVSLLCPLCTAEDGSTKHLFFECNFAKCLWTAAGLGRLIEDSTANRGEIWFKSLLENNEGKTAELILMLCDALWTQRNFRLFTDKKSGDEFLALTVGVSLRNFHEARSWPERISDELLDGSLMKSPEAGKRIWFDAGIKDGNAGLGMVAREENDAFIKASVAPVLGVSDPIFAEGLALKAAIEFSDDLRMSNAILMGDCLSLIRLVRGLDALPATYEGLVMDIRLMLTERNLSMPCWVGRDQNSEPHSIAKLAKLNLESRTSWDVPPPFILSNDIGRTFQ